MKNDRTLRVLQKALFVFVGYFLLAQLGLYFATINKNASPFWPASGFAFFVVSIFGYRYALFVFLASLLKNYFIGSGLAVSALIGCGAMLESITARYIFINLLKKRSLLTYYSRFVAVFVASTLSCVVSASLGALALAAGGITQPDKYFTSWMTWYGGDLIGSLFIFSLLMSIRLRLKSKQGLSFQEVVTVTLSFLVFVGILYSSQHIAFLMLAYPLLVVCLLGAGITGTHIFVNLVALCCCMGAQFGVGPFQLGPIYINLLCNILFLLSFGLGALALITFYRAHVLRGNLRFLFVIWFIAFGTTFGLEKYSQNKDSQHFWSLAVSARHNIESRLGDYERVLRGAAAFYRASDLVTREEWKVFAEDYDITQALPGILGVGFVQNVPKIKTQSFFKSD